MVSFKLAKFLPQLAVVALFACIPVLVFQLRNQFKEARVQQAVKNDNKNQNCPAMCNCTHVSRKHGANRLQVDCKKIGLSSIPSGIPIDAQILILDGNKISSIHGELANLSQLVELHAVDNKLSKIDAGNLTGLTSLKLLYLTRNQLTSWPDLCNDVGSSLTHLGIDENQIKGSPTAPPSYANCSSLQSLILTKNEFAHLSNATLAALGLAGALKSVKLNSVKMAAVDPTALAPLAEHLTNLDLSQNPDLPVKQLAAAFAATSFTNQFVGLTLKSMGWTELPSGFLASGNFPSLNILHLDGSAKLSVIQPDALAGGSSMTQLFLNECPLTSLDAELAGLTRLTDLNLAKTRLSAWTSATFGQLNKLLRLDLSNSAVAVIGGLDGVSENPLPNLASLADNGLRIGGNPLVCNCSLLWLSKQLGTEAIRKKFYKLDSVKCHDQASGKSIKLTDCKPANCNMTTTTTAESPTTADTTGTSTSTPSTAVKPTSTPSSTESAAPTTAAITTPTSVDTTENPAIPKTSRPGWFLPAVISGVVLGALLALTVVIGLLVRCRQRRRLGLDLDGEQRQGLVGDGSDDELGGGGGSGDCFKMMARRRARDRPGDGPQSSAAAAHDEPLYTAVDAVA